MSYKGKFSQPRNTEEAIAARAAAKKTSRNEVCDEELPLKKAPSQKSSRTTEKKAKKKANRTVTTIFYTLYFLMVLGICGGVFFLNSWLKGWLVDYEASQPTAKCEEVFSLLFSNPDWGNIYDRAGLENTEFEGRDAYISYMTNKMGDSALTYAETSAGLSGGHKYLVKLGNETLGYFTLTDQSANLTDLPDWQLGEVSMNVSRDRSVLIRSQENHTVYINGVALDDTYTIAKSSTMAENYLPGGAGLRTCLRQVDGLMAQPQITIYDENGEATSVVFDEQTGIYEEQSSATVMGPEEKERAQLTAEAYGLYMIAKDDGSRLARYFDTSSQIYRTITRMELWMQSNQGYSFANETVSEYCGYGEDLFSARVSLSLNVTRGNGTVKEYTVDQTFFFEKQNGTWKCYDMTNVNVQEPISSVRLTFVNDGTVLSSNFYDSGITELSTPVLSAPEGQVFTGWVREDVDENGAKTLTVVFTPDANGVVTIPAGTTLEPMTLYALFESASDIGGNSQ